MADRVLALLAPAAPFPLKGLLFVAVLGYLALDSLPWREIGLWVGIPLAVFGAGAALWAPAKSLCLAWWRGGWATDVVAAFLIVTIIGLIWPKTGMLGGWVHNAAPPRAITPAPAVGSMSQGFEFEGGDPAQWSSWRPVTPEAKDLVLAQARGAIAKGAPRDKVADRHAEARPRSVRPLTALCQRGDHARLVACP